MSKLWVVKKGNWNGYDAYGKTVRVVMEGMVCAAFGVAWRKLSPRA